MPLHYSIYIYSVIADVRLGLLLCVHSCIQSSAHHGPMVVLQYSLRLQIIEGF